MILDRDLFSYDDFGDCHNEIIVAALHASIILTDNQFVAIICKVRGAPRHSQQGSTLGH